MNPPSTETTDLTTVLDRLWDVRLRLKSVEAKLGIDVPPAKDGTDLEVFWLSDVRCVLHGHTGRRTARTEPSTWITHTVADVPRALAAAAT